MGVRRKKKGKKRTPSKPTGKVADWGGLADREDILAALEEVFHYRIYRGFIKMNLLKFIYRF